MEHFLFSQYFFLLVLLSFKSQRMFWPCREEYEKRLNAEIGDVRRSVQDQLAMARASGDEALENRLAETETARSRAVKQVHQLLAQWVSHRCTFVRCVGVDPCCASRRVLRFAPAYLQAVKLYKDIVKKKEENNWIETWSCPIKYGESLC